MAEPASLANFRPRCAEHKYQFGPDVAVCVKCGYATPLPRGTKRQAHFDIVSPPSKKSRSGETHEAHLKRCLEGVETAPIASLVQFKLSDECPETPFPVPGSASERSWTTNEVVPWLQAVTPTGFSVQYRGDAVTYKESSRKPDVVICSGDSINPRSIMLDIELQTDKADSPHLDKLACFLHARLDTQRSSSIAYGLLIANGSMRVVRVSRTEIDDHCFVFPEERQFYTAMSAELPYQQAVPVLCSLLNAGKAHLTLGIPDSVTDCIGAYDVLGSVTSNSVVYKLRSTGGKLYALKMKGSSSHDCEAEAAVQRMFQHIRGVPNVFSSSKNYVLMDWVEPAGRWTERHLDAGLGLLRAIHMRGVFHGDIRAPNFIVRDEQRLVCVDFERAVRADPTGSAPWSSRMSLQTASNRILGALAKSEEPLLTPRDELESFLKVFIIETAPTELDVPEDVQALHKFWTDIPDMPEFKPLYERFSAL